MKKLINSSGLLLGMFLVACVEIPIENPDQGQEIATRASINSGGQDYYWSGGRKIYIDVDPTEMIVGFETKQEAEVFTADISAENPFADRPMALVKIKDEKVKDKISADKSKKKKAKKYKYSGYDAPFLMTGDIVMKPTKDVSAEEILDKFAVDAESVSHTDIGVIVHLKDWSQILSTANAIYESGMVDWCHPDFIANIELNTNDEFFPRQYYLKNVGGQWGGTPGVDINVEPAWAISTGADIRVAVIDDGVEDHDDLAGRVLQGYTPKNSTTYGKPTNNGMHGQAVAGIIAASHNGSYIAGVAPEVQIIPINIFYGGESTADIAAGIEYAWNPNKGNADVINNSWSYEEGNVPRDADIIETQINSATTQGRLRNGVRKGCIVVFSSSNDYNTRTVNYPGTLSDVISVGAVDKYGAVWDYSNRGTGLDVVAPSGEVMKNGNMLGDVYTLDRNDFIGYDYGNYTDAFGGTSAAAPQVSGIAALMLSVFPDLTQQQVTEAILGSAEIIGGYSHTSKEYGEWSNEVGYGLVDAYEALIAGFKKRTQITGSDKPAWNTNVTYSIPTTMPAGITFDGWEVRRQLPAQATTFTTSGLTGRDLSVRFIGYGKHIITANFTLPDGSDYSTTKTVEVTPPSNYYIAPVLSSDKTSVIQGERVVFSIPGPLPPGVTYEWMINDELSTMHTTNNIVMWADQRGFTVQCRVRYSSIATSQWSNTVVVTFGNGSSSIIAPQLAAHEQYAPSGQKIYDITLYHNVPQGATSEYRYEWEILDGQQGYNYGTVLASWITSYYSPQMTFDTYFDGPPRMFIIKCRATKNGQVSDWAEVRIDGVTKVINTGELTTLSTTQSAEQNLDQEPLRFEVDGGWIIVEKDGTSEE
jgi:subtilisin family serine protease